MPKKTKVLIVDDSALIRKLLTEILASDPELEVVDTAKDPYDAREKIKRLNPDVITLDVEMPKMDGITFLANIMRLRPMPVVMVSSLTQQGADVALTALELGAVDYVAKPKIGVRDGLLTSSRELLEKVKAAAHARVRAPKKPRLLREVEAKHSADVILPRRSAPRLSETTDGIIAFGSSTGGTEAIHEVMAELPPDTPGIVITQHIPQTFSARFAERLDQRSALRVAEARDGERILLGHAYVAPGNKHLLVERCGARYVCRLNDGLPVNRHRPSADVLFRSVAQSAGVKAMGIILTGMGEDGARGLEEMHAAGGYTIAQDRETSVVWGMPGAAVKRGAAREVLPLEAIARKIIAHVRRSG